MAVACAGYRTSGVGHHKTTFEAAELALGAGSAPFTTYFDACRRKRNTVDYDRAHVATETEATEVVKNGLHIEQTRPLRPPKPASQAYPSVWA